MQIWTILYFQLEIETHLRWITLLCKENDNHEIKRPTLG